MNQHHNKRFDMFCIKGMVGGREEKRNDEKPHGFNG